MTDLEIAIGTKDQDLLWSIRDSKEDLVRHWVARRIASQDRLWEMKDDDNWYVRRVMTERLEDQDRLWEMRNDKDIGVRCTVAERIEDLDRLWEMRAAETNTYVIKAIDVSINEMSDAAKEDTV